MIKMINRITGTEMYVDETRVNEYIALGHHTAIPTLDELKGKVEEPLKPKRGKKKV